jgi:hypothetical protein
VEGAKKRKAANGMDPTSKRKRGDEHKSRSKAPKEPVDQPVEEAKKRKAASGMDPTSKRKRGDEQELTPKASGKGIGTKLIPPL